MVHVAADGVWVILGVLAYVVVGYPLLLGIIAAFAPERQSGGGGSNLAPAVSLIITARNEAAGIVAKLRNCDALEYPADRLEIIVASDASDDGTDELVRNYAATPRLGAAPIRLLRLPAWRGKTQAQNRAVASARGEILVFSDATTHYDRDALRWLVAAYGDQRVAGVTGRVVFCGGKRGAPGGWAARAFWAYESRMRRAQARLGLLAVCSGCIYSIRADRYQALPPERSSDLAEPLRLAAAGFRIAYEPRAIGREAAAASRSEEFRMRRRVVAGGLAAVGAEWKALGPWRHPWLCFHLLSHKVGRWCVGPLLLGLWAASLLAGGANAYRWLFAAQAGFYLLAVASLAWQPRRFRPALAIPGAIALGAGATLAAWYDVLRGRKHARWRPERAQA